jgi:CheY-like chemotaxis protein
MFKKKPNLLVVDDEKYIHRIIQTYLKNEGYNILQAHNGLEAWELIQNYPENVDAVLLDREMPHMTGLELLKHMKSHDPVKNVPVIFQTSLSNETEIMEGIRAGAYYYLTKPYNEKVLRAVVNAALTEFFNYKSLRQEIHQTKDVMPFIQNISFQFQNLEEGKKISTWLANICPDPSKNVVGLWELFINAIEHGNLGISYAEKTALNEENKWNDEIDRRLELAEYKSKKVTAVFKRGADGLYITVKDQGTGFDWRKYLELSPERAFDNHGRGIALAGKFSFDLLEYQGTGNQVLAFIKQ